MPACGTRGTQTIISMDCGSLLPLFRGSPAAAATPRITRSSLAHAKSLGSRPTTKLRPPFEEEPVACLSKGGCLAATNGH